MNELGLTLAWLAVQVSLMLVPALLLYAMAARRGPDRAAWAAALSLTLVVVLNVAALLPGLGRGRRIGDGRIDEALAPAAVATPAESAPAEAPDAPRRPMSGAGPLAAWRVAWARLERGAAGPAERCRRWGSTLAAVALAGTAAGLLRLIIGLGGIVACRRRGKPVDDQAMIGLLDELRGAIGCRATIELREIADLVGPATAGWQRPMILLPEDWRSWDEAERRAALAHELAHVVRGDYAAGLIARLAVALNYYHPLVRWMAGRLRLQQELAADAIGARHAGGRAGYLVALSRLALRQDGRSPCWPARAFLPARGTLIRRIAMLRDGTRNGRMDGPCSRARRLAAATALLGVTAVVAMLRGPARAGEDGAPAPAETRSGTLTARTALAPLPPLYLHEGMDGVIVLRPAAAVRLVGTKRLMSLVALMSEDFEFSQLAKQLGVDTTRPGFIRLGLEDLDCITLALGFGRTSNQGEGLHSIKFGYPTFRTVAPFDWLAYLRQWRLEFAEVREGGHVYYRITGPLREALGPDPCVFLPDDRTIVCDEEKVIRKLAGQGDTPPPDFLRGPDWERASRGLLAVAITNRDGSFAKHYDLGRPDDSEVLTLFRGVDHWTFSVEPAHALALQAAAACASSDASGTIARSIEALVKQGRKALDVGVTQVPPGEVQQRCFRMMKALLANLRVEHADRTVAFRTGGVGTIAEVIATAEAEVRSEAYTGNAKGAPKTAKP
jgi:hypothetical protein